jgi:hypothetical protein
MAHEEIDTIPYHLPIISDSRAGSVSVTLPWCASHVTLYHFRRRRPRPSAWHQLGQPERGQGSVSGQAALQEERHLDHGCVGGQVAAQCGPFAFGLAAVPGPEPLGHDPAARVHVDGMSGPWAQRHAVHHRRARTRASQRRRDVSDVQLVLAG